LLKVIWGKNAYKEIDIDNRCKLNLNTFNGQMGLDRIGFHIRASLNFSKNDLYTPSIEVSIWLSDKFSQQHFNNLYKFLVGAIGHEIGHYYQYRYERENMEESVQEKPYGMLNRCIKIRGYILSRMDLIPYIKGLVIKHKKQNVSFEKVLDEDLNYLLFYNNSKYKMNVMRSQKWGEISEIISDIKNNVIEKAKQLYPHLRR
jgi:hypothetical protein